MSHTSSYPYAVAVKLGDSRYAQNLNTKLGPASSHPPNTIVRDLMAANRISLGMQITKDITFQAAVLIPAGNHRFEIERISRELDHLDGAGHSAVQNTSSPPNLLGSHPDVWSVW